LASARILRSGIDEAIDPPIICTFLYFCSSINGKVETLLYKLSGKQRVSVKWILPLLTVVMKNWKIYTGLYEIGTLLIL
jgi:hypothetical protein